MSVPLAERQSGALLVFCNDLEAGVRQSAQRDLEALRVLREAAAVDRADTLFEAVADLSDALVSHEAGRVNETVVRAEALRVCRLAVLLWLSVCAGEDEDDGR
jgi:hypothetical protein